MGREFENVFYDVPTIVLRLAVPALLSLLFGIIFLDGGINDLGELHSKYSMSQAAIGVFLITVMFSVALPIL